MLFLALIVLTFCFRRDYPVHFVLLTSSKMSDLCEPHQMLFIWTSTLNANQGSSGQPRDMCQPPPRFLKKEIISQYSASRDLPLPFDIFWEGCSFLGLTESCLTECKPANRIGPHGLHLKGQEPLTAIAQSELRYSCRDWREMEAPNGIAMGQHFLECRNYSTDTVRLFKANSALWTTQGPNC